MMGGLGSSSATVLAGMEKSFGVILLWFIRKFGAGFGISSCCKRITHIKHKIFVSLGTRVT